MNQIPPLPFNSNFSIKKLICVILFIFIFLIPSNIYSFGNHVYLLQSVVVAESSIQVKIQWTDNFLDEDGFQIFRRSGRFGRFHMIQVTDPNVSSWIDTTVKPDTLYVYYIQPRIRGWAFSPMAFTITPEKPRMVPAKPEYLSAEVLSPESIKLEWTDMSDNEYGFRIERKTVDGDFVPVNSVGPQSTSLIDSGPSLRSKEAYIYRVISFNPAGDSQPSNEVKVTIPMTPGKAPLSPANLTCTPLSFTIISLEWTDNACNEEHYTIERKGSGEKEFSVIKELSGNAQGFIDTGLDAGSGYTYRVRAYNSQGFSPYTEEVDATTMQAQRHTPNDPLYLIATATSAFQIDLSWIDNSDNEFGYIVQRKEKMRWTGHSYGKNYKPWDYFYKNVAIIYNSTTWTDNDVKPDTMYEYKVSSFNNKNMSRGFYAASVQTPDIPVTIPEIPAYVTGSSLAAHQVDLKWKDTSGDEDGFVIERMIPGDDFYPVKTVPSTTTEWSDKNICSSSYFVYRIRSFNRAGSSDPSPEIIVYPVSHPAAVPAEPSHLETIPLSATRMKLSWSDNSDDENGFIVERRTKDCGYRIVAAISRNNPGFIIEQQDTDLLPGTEYMYRVSAYNIYGNSGYSNETYNTTLSFPGSTPLSPTILSGKALAPHHIYISWTCDASDEEGFIIQRKQDRDFWTNIHVAGVDVNEWVDSHVSEDTMYMYRIAAYNLHGQSFWSEPISVSSLLNPISSSLSTVVVTPDSVDANGVDSADIFVTINDVDGNPVEGVKVIIQATGIDTIITQPESPTDAAGRVSGAIASTSAGEKIITIIVNPGPENLELDDQPIVTFFSTPRTRLVFTVQPSHTFSGGIISPAVQLEFQDASGNCITGASNVVTLTLGMNPVNTILYGTKTLQAVNGKVSFADLYIDTYAENYTIVASSDNCDSVESERFTILPLELTIGNDGNGSTVPQGPIRVNYREEILIKAVPQDGYHFVEWKVVNGTVTIDNPGSESTTVTMNHDNSTVHAVFDINVYSISSTSGPDGTISPSGDVFIPYGGSQSFSIVPDEHYHIQDVSVDGISVGAVPVYEFTQVTGNHTIQAEFALDTFIISAEEVENGNINPSFESVVPSGGSLLYTITPDEHYHIQDVYIDYVSVGVVTEYEFVQVTENHNIYAEFAIDTFIININEGENGSITPAGGSVVEYGGSLVYTITPDEHYHIQDVFVDGVSVGPVTEYEFVQV
ncbi:MAG: Ig-like domain-containing protein, partial [Spirochaetales bacterium]|nr:Ig-like domain-containing protein [Spirochaetales bacterium]